MKPYTYIPALTFEPSTEEDKEKERVEQVERGEREEQKERVKGEEAVADPFWFCGRPSEMVEEEEIMEEGEVAMVEGEEVVKGEEEEEEDTWSWFLLADRPFLDMDFEVMDQLLEMLKMEEEQPDTSTVPELSSFPIPDRTSAPSLPGPEDSKRTTRASTTRLALERVMNSVATAHEATAHLDTIQKGVSVKTFSETAVTLLLFYKVEDEAVLRTAATGLVAAFPVQPDDYVAAGLAAYRHSAAYSLGPYQQLLTCPSLLFTSWWGPSLHSLLAHVTKLEEAALAAL